MSLSAKWKSITSSLSNPNTRPPLEGLYIYILAATVGYGAADLTVLNYRPELLPKKAPSLRKKSNIQSLVKPKSAYQTIEDRNIFSADGKIPPALSVEEEEGPQVDEDAPAVLSKLPIKLLGTIVHLNPKKSIATVNLSSKNQTNSFRVGEEIERMAKVLKVERRKLIFRNLANNRKEYVEIPEDSKLTFGLKSPGAKSQSASGSIRAEGANKFSISRTELEKYTSDLSGILQQARMVPNIVPGSGGRIDGFRFVSIQPDSVFSKLGFKPGDVIKGVDGEPVTSPTQAMEMYNTMKNSDKVSLDVTRDGRDETFDYSIE